MSANDDDKSPKKRKSTEIVCITGPQWVSEDYYKIQYRGPVEAAFADGAHFIVGAAKEGVDRFAQLHLAQLCGVEKDRSRVTVHDKHHEPEKLDRRFVADKDFNVVDTHASYPERDVAMALLAHRLIYVAPQFGAATSGSMLVLLTFELKDAALAKKVFASIRAKSESPAAFERLLGQVTPLYAQIYSYSVHMKEVVGAMAEASGMKFVDM